MARAPGPPGPGPGGAGGQLAACRTRTEQSVAITGIMMMMALTAQTVVTGKRRVLLGDRRRRGSGVYAIRKSFHGKSSN